MVVISTQKNNPSKGIQCSYICAVWVVSVLMTLISFCRGAGQEVGRSCIILEFKGRKIMVIIVWMYLYALPVCYFRSLKRSKMLQVKFSLCTEVRYSARKGTFCSILEQYSMYDIRHHRGLCCKIKPYPCIKCMCFQPKPFCLKSNAKSNVS